MTTTNNIDLIKEELNEETIGYYKQDNANW